MKFRTGNRNKIAVILLLIAAPLLLNGCYATTNLDNTELLYVPDTRVLAEGKALFQTYCVECHGADLMGTGPRAATLSTKPANLRSKSLHLTRTSIKTVMDFPHYSQEAIKDKIKYGNNVMPPLKTVLSKNEIDSLVQYISNAIRTEQ